MVDLQDVAFRAIGELYVANLLLQRQLKERDERIAALEAASAQPTSAGESTAGVQQPIPPGG